MFYPSPIPPNGWPGQKPVKEHVPYVELSLQEALKNIDPWEEDVSRTDRKSMHSRWVDAQELGLLP